MNREKFVERNLESMLSSGELKQHFFDDDGKRRTDARSEELYETLKSKVEASYDGHAKNYFENRGFFSKYIAPVFRGVGAALDFAGDILYIPTGGWSLAVTKLPGAVIKTLADAMDGTHYLTHGDYKSGKDLLGILGETAAERVAAYLPLYGLGSGLDALRGRSKFDRRVAKYALREAKEDFVREVGEQPIFAESAEEPLGVQYFMDESESAEVIPFPVRPQQEIRPLTHFQRHGYEMAA
jgi:hypothetical protein